MKEEIKEDKQEITDDELFPLERLPDEILVMIFSYFNLRTLYEILSINKRFLQIVFTVAKPVIRQLAIDFLESQPKKILTTRQPIINQNANNISLSMQIVHLLTLRDLDNMGEKVEKELNRFKPDLNNEAFALLKKITGTTFYKEALLEEEQINLKKQIQWSIWHKNKNFIFTLFFLGINIIFAFTLIDLILIIFYSIGEMVGVSCQDKCNNHCADGDAKIFRDLVNASVVAIISPIISAAIWLLNTALEIKLTLSAFDRKSTWSNTLVKLTYYLRFPILSALAGWTLYYGFVADNVDVSKCVSFADDPPHCGSAKFDMTCINQIILPSILIKAPFGVAGISSSLALFYMICMIVVDLPSFAVKTTNAVREWCYTRFFATPTQMSSTNNNSDEKPLLIVENPDDNDESIELQIF